MKEEIWKPVRGYENLYEVSSFGKIRSVDKVVLKSWIIKSKEQFESMKYEV